MRAVLDTNIIVSGLNFPGNERRVLYLARARRYELYISEYLIAEVAGVLQRKFGWDGQLAEQTMALLREVATVVQPVVKVSLVRGLDADNRVLECALEAHADYLVTGDRRHLLPLGEFNGTRIVPSTIFLAALGDLESG